MECNPLKMLRFNRHGSSYIQEQETGGSKVSQKPVRNSADVGTQNCFGMSENKFVLFTFLQFQSQIT